MQERDLERLDASLASLAREEGALRLRLGQLLEVMGRGAVFELGFSSLGAYAVERCERSVRWAEGARCVARRVELLPELRRAMAFGVVTWSMGELIARVASPGTQTRWLELAQSRTVRQMRAFVAEVMAERGETRAAGPVRDMSPLERELASAGVKDARALLDRDDDDELSSLDAGNEDDICTLRCTVDREDAWLFEATRCLLDQLGERGPVAQCEALLAEGQGALLARLPAAELDLEGVQEAALLEQRRMELLRRWRMEAEACFDSSILGKCKPGPASNGSGAGEAGLVRAAAAIGMGPLEHASCGALDHEVRAISAALARHELELSVLVLRHHRANGWRHLGYASEGQYARERLGMSRSSLVAHRALALRLEALPVVATALGAGQLGVEAAVQLVRIATPQTAAAWVERARRRTIKHLREEVSAALVAVRLSGERHCPPPRDDEIIEYHSLEQAVVSGFACMPGASPRQEVAGAASVGADPHCDTPPSEERRAWWSMLGSLTSWLKGGQMSAAPVSAANAHSSAGRVTLRLRMSRETAIWWRALEARAQRWLPRGMSWLRFMCRAVWQSWRHVFSTRVSYGHIYIRDRFRCMNPVCNRRDVTPHHFQFRSAGGSDHDSNVGSICTWCHLCGIHGGRIRVQGSADHLHWELGPRSSPVLIVEGRERMVGQG